MHPRMRIGEVIAHDQGIGISDMQRKLLARRCDTAVARMTNHLGTAQLHRATRNTALLLTRIEDFDHRAMVQPGVLRDLGQQALMIALGRLLRLTTPITTNIAGEI
jgi:hypothetical protein